jgi:hypothetical protein
VQTYVSDITIIILVNIDYVSLMFSLLLTLKLG